MPRKSAPKNKKYKLYKLEYNWFGDVDHVYRHALNPSWAYEFMCRAVAAKYKVITNRVRQHFREGNRYTITEVVRLNGDTARGNILHAERERVHFPRPAPRKGDPVEGVPPHNSE